MGTGDASFSGKWHGVAKMWQSRMRKKLEDGDIICFQKASSLDTEENIRYPDVPSYLEYVHNRQISLALFSLHAGACAYLPKEDDFFLEMSRLYTYDDTSDILYYEVLDIPLPELQGLKTLKVAFATKDEVFSHTIRLPKQSTVGDVLDDLKTKVELSDPEAELRLLEVFYHKIYKVFPPNEKLENINDQYWTLRAEEIPEEEKNLGPHDRLIHVYHFNKDTAQNQMQIQNFGEPFFLVIHEGETLSEIKVRIQKKLQVPDDEFAKVLPLVQLFDGSLHFLSLGRPEYLQDSDIVSSRFQRRDVYGAWEQYLGLEHTDNAPKRSYAVNQEPAIDEFIMYEFRIIIYLWACTLGEDGKRLLCIGLMKSAMQVVSADFKLVMC
ncbi:unnamed protein product [Sphenostylis stenocarpa]|uniref:ubiquitinyl hydrolase 1 n=1 Tax=Sphenostylis stenocarpa TaxID=92480 RepID=A0AA86T7J8_9FABA|nr:unnamed protein product [Sphenostylis stenocarpa]